MENQKNDISSSLKRFSSKKIQKWSSSLQSSQTKADLAVLRKNIGKQPFDCIESWPIILDGLDEETDPILNSLYCTGEKYSSSLTKGEIALFYAFSLYAVHQQSISDKSMHQKDQSFGKSLSQLAQRKAKDKDSLSDEIKKIIKRLNALAGKKNLKMQMSDLRGLISLLHSVEVPVDYVQLTDDLLKLQFPRSKNKVLIHWINDFNRSKFEEEKENE